MSDTAPLVVDEGVLAKLDQDRRQAEIARERAESTAETYRLNAESSAQRVWELDAVGKFLEAHIGMPLAELLVEVERELEKAEARVAETRAVADQRRQELRDWEGYRRIMKGRVAELAEDADPAGTP